MLKFIRYHFNKVTLIEMKHIHLMYPLICYIEKGNPPL